MNAQIFGGAGKAVDPARQPRQVDRLRDATAAQVLRPLQGRRFVELGDLFDPSRGAQVLVVTFIAMLELAKETLIELTQAEAFAPIYVRLAYTPTP